MNTKILAKLLTLFLILMLLPLSGCVDSSEEDTAFVYGTASLEEVRIDMKMEG